MIKIQQGKAKRNAPPVCPCGRASIHGSEGKKRWTTTGILDVLNNMKECQLVQEDKVSVERKKAPRVAARFLQTNNGINCILSNWIFYN